MKYLLLCSFLLFFYFSNAQSGKNRIKLGGQITLTPYLSSAGTGYYGGYEYALSNRFSVAFGFGQAVGKQESKYGSSGLRNGTPFDFSFFLNSREGINYLEVNMLSRIFRSAQRNHLKFGLGLTLQSVWVEYNKDVNAVSGVIQELSLNKQIKNLGLTNFVFENDFYLTPKVFFNAKIVIKAPIYFADSSSFERSVRYTSSPIGFGGGNISSVEDLTTTATLIMGVGYKF